MTSRLSVALLIALCLASVAAAEVVRWVPAAAAVDGRFGTQWTTDLWIYSRVQDAEITVSVAFLTNAEGTTSPSEVSLQIPPSTAVEIHDVITTLFGVRAAGALRLRSDHEFEARSRTLNDGGDAGTFGQGIPAVAADAALVDNRLLGAANRPGEGGTRTNLGILNPNPRPVSVYLWVFSGEGSTQTIGRQASIDLGPFGWRQVDLFDLVGAAAEDVANATVTLASLGDGPVITYLSRVDNVSGDGTYLTAFPARVFRLDPQSWEVTITLTYGSDAIASPVRDVVVVHTGPDGDDVTVADPPSGWFATVAASTGDTFCYDATGIADLGGWMVVTVDLVRDGQAYGRSRREQTGASGFHLHDCFDLD